jgi:hypothetical protein
MIRSEPSLTVSEPQPAEPGPSTSNASAEPIARPNAANPMFSSVKWGKEPDALPGWRFCFPNEPFSSVSLIMTWVQAVMVYFKENPKLYGIKKCSETLAMPCALEIMLTDVKLNRDWTNFGKYIVNEPAKSLAALGLNFLPLKF